MTQDVLYETPVHGKMQKVLGTFLYAVPDTDPAKTIVTVSGPSLDGTNVDRIPVPLPFQRFCAYKADSRDNAALDLTPDRLRRLSVVTQRKEGAQRPTTGAPAIAPECCGIG